MTKKTPLILAIFLLLFLSTGCVERELVLHDPDSAGASWAEQSNVNDINISDLDENLTESETMITESSESEKGKRMPFPASEYAKLPRTGRGTVKGSIFVKNLYGEKVMGGGTRLYLNPATSYSEQWYNQSYLEGKKMERADARLFNYLKFTAANSSGKFAFYGVPSGSYYLIGTVKCGRACGYDGIRNIRIATKVSVYGSQVVEQDLTRSMAQ